MYEEYRQINLVISTCDHKIQNYLLKSELLIYATITFCESQSFKVKNFHFFRKKSAKRKNRKGHTRESVCTVNKYVANWHFALFAKSVGVAAGKGERWR